MGFFWSINLILALGGEKPDAECQILFPWKKNNLKRKYSLKLKGGIVSRMLTLTNTTWILGCHPQHGARVYKGIYEYGGSLENNLFYPQAHR